MRNNLPLRAPLGELPHERFLRRVREERARLASEEAARQGEARSEAFFEARERRGLTIDEGRLSVG